MANRPGRRAPLGSEGFTLIEMAVVALVLLIVANYAYPKFRNLSELNMKSAIRRIGALARFAHGEAISKNREMALELDLDGRSYRLVAAPAVRPQTIEEQQVRREDQGLDRAFSNCSGYTTYSQSMLAAGRDLPQGVAFRDVVVEDVLERVEEGKVCVAFSGGGRVKAAVIHLIDEYDHEWTLLLNPFTGRMKVLEGYQEFLINDAGR